MGPAPDLLLVLRSLLIRVTAVAACAAAATVFAADRHQPVDTQPSGRPLPPRDGAARIRVPAGFQVTLAAAEPDVRQPIALAYDARGRLWVAESYSYAGSTFTEERHDRILIFEDADGDGVFESRKVFHDQLNRLTGLALGFGGVWVTTAPHLAFIPDRNGDDVPDGDARVHLDGWTLEAEHNTVNGLTWGPDGWLYGRHGIKKASLVGRPGAPAADRLEVGCAIWRYHPTRHAFEVVADGTINPWGLDFDAFGQAFMSTSVVDHLWHVVPGARFERWKDRGGHPDPYSYELMTSTSDHLHWGGGAWDKGGRLSGGNDALGGGHSHCDAMIYLGDRWPAEYRGAVFMSNIHGRRINRDTLARLPADGGYVARHQPDFITVDDPWFRAISLVYGPDGDVVMSDWADFGECHDRDGVHRSSGRLYKISWGAPRRVAVDLGGESSEALVALQRHANEFHVRHARRLLQERAHAGQDMSAPHAALQTMLRESTATVEKLRALWTLHVTRGTTSAGLMALLDSPDEHVRYWAVRLLTEEVPAPAIVARLVAHARTESRWLVQMALASALQRIDVPARTRLAHAVAAALTPTADPNLIRLLWYGLQPTVLRDPAASSRLALATPAPSLRRFVARRLAEAMADDAAAGDALIGALGGTSSEAVQLDLLAAMELGLKGRRQVRAPREAARVLLHLRQSGTAAVQAPALRLAAMFGDESALAALRRTMNDRTAPNDDRVASLERLAELKVAWLVDDLLALVRAGDLTEPALNALPGFSDRRIVEVVVSVFPKLSATARAAAIQALIARADSARGLLDAVAAGRIDRREISLVQARQIAQLGDVALAGQLDRVWGSVGKPSSETEGTLRRLRHELTPAVLHDADLAAGSRVYDQRCSACHRLFGRGQSIGPDLTGSGRKDLEYLLLNVVDPNAVIASDYRLSVVTLKDGQVHSGSIVKETDRALTLRTMTAEVTVERADIRSTQRLPMSLMPPGLFEALSATELRDLVGYLMSDGADAIPPVRP